MLGEDDSDKIVLSPQAPSKKVLIEEISSKTLPPKKKGKSTEPEHRLFADHDNSNRQILIAEFYMPDVREIIDITIEANDDRLMVTSQKHGYAFDGFLPHKVDEKKTLAEFDNERAVRNYLKNLYIY